VFGYSPGISPSYAREILRITGQSAEERHKPTSCTLDKKPERAYGRCKAVGVQLVGSRGPIGISIADEPGCNQQK
jgi:hypothetical protein